MNQIALPIMVSQREGTRRQSVEPAQLTDPDARRHAEEPLHGMTTTTARRGTACRNSTEDTFLADRQGLRTGWGGGSGSGWSHAKVMPNEKPGEERKLRRAELVLSLAVQPTLVCKNPT